MATLDDKIQELIQRADSTKTSAENLKAQLEEGWANTIYYASTVWLDVGYYTSNAEYYEDQELSGNRITEWQLRPAHRDQRSLWYDNHTFLDTLGTTTITSKRGIVIQAGYDSTQKKEKAPPYDGEVKNFIIDVANNLIIDVVNDFQISGSDGTINCTLLDVNANVDISGTLVVGGNTTINGTATIEGNTEINSNTTITGIVEITGNTSITGNTIVIGIASISGNTTIGDSLTVDDLTTLNNGLVVSNNSIFLPETGEGTTEGEFIFDTIDSEVKVYSGGQWNTVWPSYVEFSSNGSVTTVQGARGPRGYTGSAGTAGTNGTNGTNGTDGADGADGSQGPIGYTGSAGSPVGYTGSRGDTGPAGADGAEGPAGPAGGYTGSKGTIGYTGSSSRVNVSNTAPASAVSGDMWFDNDDGLFSVYYNDGDSSQWVVAAGKQGIQGYTGSAAADVTVDSNRYDLTAAKPLRLPRLTTTERNGITAEAGDIIFNTTDSQIQYHNGSTWTAL